jgi:hypothetical protein
LLTAAPPSRAQAVREFVQKYEKLGSKKEA